MQEVNPMPIVAATSQSKNAFEKTWGHLKPKMGQKYPGFIIVAVGLYGDRVIIKEQFDQLDGSPWWYTDVHNFIDNELHNLFAGVYRFDGWYKRFKNGNCQFGGGKFIHIQLPYQKCTGGN